MTDNIVIEELKNFKYWNKSISLEVLDYCQNRFDDIKPYANKISEFVYRLENKIEKNPRCPVCGKELKFLTYRDGYLKVCSKKCKFSKTGKSLMKMHRKHKDNYKYCCDIYSEIKKYEYSNIDDDYIKLVFLNDGKLIISKANLKYLIRNQLFDIIAYLVNRYDGYNIEKPKVISEIIYRIVNNIEEIPKCEICGETLEYINYTFGYGLYCKQCKSDKTKLAKHVTAKSRKTYKEKTGVENPFGNPKIRKEIRDKWISKGYENPMQSEGVKKHLKNTMIEKYGVETMFLLDEVKEKSHSQDAIDKCDETKRKNKSYSSSKVEDKVYQMLIDNGLNVLRNYKSKLYHWKCDFYLVDYELYVELQGTWLHGGHPYNCEDICDIEKLKQLKLKQDKPMYKGAINVWTNTDVVKRLVAINNRLNYLEIFSCDALFVYNEILSYINNKQSGYFYKTFHN